MLNHAARPATVTLALISLLALALTALPGQGDPGSAPTAAQVEFFETHIRPVLANRCYRCHNSTRSTQGGLALDSRAGLHAGGVRGPVLNPGKPAQSRLLSVLRHAVPGLEMPRGEAKLAPGVIAQFEKWIAMGAPDPRDKAPAPAALATAPDAASSWPAVFAARRKWWSFAPLRNPVAPPVRNSGWSSHPVDRFLLAKLEQRGLAPAAPADRRTLLRRVTFALRGLPPTPGEMEAFLADRSPSAYEQVVDRLLAAPAFGERWARHWMDLVRYAESHGSQGDPVLPMAWQYRDYLIRAFNADVPYDQLMREHLAGDLLPHPRLNPTEKWNESTLGTAQLRMGELGYVPVDALEDQVKVVDNQIDVFSKTFLGLTVSCARCHNHKFDPISQEDFYALYGVFASCRPGQVVVDAPELLTKNRGELAERKQTLRGELAKAWLASASSLTTRLAEQARRTTEMTTLRARAARTAQAVAATENRGRTAVLRARAGAPASLQTAPGSSAPPASEGPTPLARWSFDGGAQDGVGALHGQVLGGALFRNGRLVLSGRDAAVRTAPLAADLRAATLEVWLTLANLEQRGGGAISIETADGAMFDALVFSETEPRRWISGSDLHRRSRLTGGPAETAGPGELVHLAIAYDPDGGVAVYRNGELYGTAYRPGARPVYAAGSARFLFGQRHTGGGNAFLAAEIEEARAYDRALSAEEVAASFRAGPATPGMGVTEAELSRVLSREERAVLDNDRAELRRIRGRLAALEGADPVSDPWAAAFAAADRDPTHPLHAWIRLSGSSGENLRHGWNDLAASRQRERRNRLEFNRTHFTPAWNLPAGDYQKWYRSGTGLRSQPAPGGEFCVEIEGDRLLRGIYPAGVFTHGLTRKDGGVLTSPRFKIETDSVSVRALGEHSVARVVIENYALGGGGIYPAARLDRDEMGWIRFDTAYRKGAHAYIEFVTADDYPKPSLPGSGSRPYKDGRAYFGASEVVFHQGAAPPQEVDAPIEYLFQGSPGAAPGPGDGAAPGDPPSTPAELAARYTARLRSALEEWKAGTLSPAAALFLDAFVRNNLLPTTLTELPHLGSLVEEYRQLERDVPVARRAPGVHEAVAFDQPLFVRGLHTLPARPVSRRSLSLFGGREFRTTQSGRLELAQELTAPLPGGARALTARVIVNRLWHHLFGRGIVPTVDNFGHLGEPPSHPELLDFLAVRFVERGWSIKDMLRFLVTSRAYRQSSEPGEAALRADPRNELLSHMPVRRLEAEAIRDSLLAVSGQLLPKMYGPGVNVYYVGKTEGGGPVGPLDGERRRSIYLSIRRNAQNPFLEAFDAPRPSTTRGRRDTTNVPAQSLTMLNDPFVIGQAAAWAKAVTADGPEPQPRIRGMFLRVLGRPPSAAEVTRSLEYLQELANEHRVAAGELPRHERVWQDFAQSLFCLKEFLYVR